MNVVRRVLLALYSLVFLAALGGIAKLAWFQDEQLDINIKSLNLQAFISSSDPAKYNLSSVLAGLAVLGFITLLIAIWPRRSKYRSKGTLRIRQADGGTVEVTALAIESLLKSELEALPEVRSAAPRVRLAGGAVDTYIDANIEPSASIAQATKLLGSTVEQTLKEHVGVTSVRRPVIRITYDEMGVRPAGARRPPAPYDAGFNPPIFPNDTPPAMSPETRMKPPAAAEATPENDPWYVPGTAEAPKDETVHNESTSGEINNPETPREESPPDDRT
ncbi:MAG: alkaline shock response membrane anchor protein AmaP [bacterium]